MELKTFLTKKHVANILVLYNFAQQYYEDRLKENYPKQKIVIAPTRAWGKKKAIDELLKLYESGELRRRYLPKSLKELKKELAKIMEQKLMGPKIIKSRGGVTAVAPWQRPIGFTPKELCNLHFITFKTKIQRSNAQKLLDQMAAYGLLEKTINPVLGDEIALSNYNNFLGIYRYMKRKGQIKGRLSKQRRYFITSKGKVALAAITELDKISHL